MVDPTSDHNEDVPEEEAPRCAVCDVTLVENPNHRVITRVEDDTVVTTHFCSEDCRTEWSS